MKGRPIYSIGSLRLAECAMREDGVWFIRHRRIGRPGFGAWTVALRRPANAWYNPSRGLAHLPKD